MATQVPFKKNTAATLYVGLVSQANTKLFQVNPTLAAGDVKSSLDGGAFGNLATLPVVTPATGRAVKVDLSAAEMNGDNVVVQFVDAAGAEWCDLVLNLQTATRQMDDLAFPATSGRSLVVDAAGLVDANAVKVGPTGAGTAQTAADIPGRLPAALVGGRIDASVGAIAAGVGSGVRKNVALAKFEFLMTDSTNHAPATGKTVTVTRSIDNAAFAAGTLSAVTEIAFGVYSVDFGAGDLNGTAITLRATATGCDDLLVTIVPDP